MISKREWVKIYNKLSIIDYLKRKTSGSKTRILRGSGVGYDIGYVLLEEMMEDNMISIKEVARNSWVTLNKNGVLFYTKYKELMEMIT